MIKMDVTLVTAFLDIGRENWDHWKRSSNAYLEAFKKYLNFDYRMVIYIDDKYYDEIKSICKDNIVIPINEKWMEENSWCWRQLEKEKNIMENPNYINLIKHRITCPETHNPKYTLINHAKIDFVVDAMKYIDSNYVAWSDFGYFGVANSIPKNILDIRKFDLERINLCSFKLISEKDTDIIYTLQHAPEIMNGYFFFGPKKLLKEYQILYHSKLEEFQNAGFADDDQHLMIRCVIKKPEIFRQWIFPRWHIALQYFQKDD